MREVARIPLLLSLFAFAFKDLGEDARDLHNLTRGDVRDKIFETYVKRRYEREARKPQTWLPFAVDELADVLGQVAMRMAGFSPSENLYHPSEFSQIVGEAKAHELIEFALRLHLLIRSDIGRLRFIHLLLRDYFIFKFAMQHLRDLKMYDLWGLDSTPARTLGVILQSLHHPDPVVRGVRAYHGETEN